MPRPITKHLKNPTTGRATQYVTHIEAYRSGLVGYKATNQAIEAMNNRIRKPTGKTMAPPPISQPKVRQNVIIDYKPTLFSYSAKKELTIYKEIKKGKKITHQEVRVPSKNPYHGSFELTRRLGESEQDFNIRADEAMKENINYLNSEMIYDTGAGGGNTFESYSQGSMSSHSGGNAVIGMLRANPYQYEDSKFTSVIDTGNCVPKSLSILYPKWSLERIEEEMGGPGLKTCENVLDWCKFHDITCIGCDEKFNILVEYYSRNRNHAPLYFVEKDNHFYVMDKTKGRSIASSRSNSVKTIDKKDDKKKPMIEKIIDDNILFSEAHPWFSESNVHYIVSSASVLKTYLDKYIVEKHSVPKMSYGTLNERTVFVRSFKFGDNCKMSIDKHRELIMKLSKKFKIEANTLNDISQHLLKETVNLKRSHLNQTVFNIMKDWRKRQHYAHLMEPDEWATVQGEEQTWDQNKQYTNALLNARHNWLVFDMTSLPMPYSGGIKDAYYFIKTQNVMPCKGNGWYSRIILEYLIENKIEHTVQYEIISNNTMPKNTFVPFVKKAVDTTVDFKHITNTMCGSLNISKSSSVRGTATANVCDAVRTCMTSDAILVPIVDEIYASASISVKHKTVNNMPMYAQILDFAAVEVTNMIKHLKAKGCIIRGYNTDSITFKYPQVLRLDVSTTKIGGWKTETSKPYSNIVNPIQCKDIYEYEEPQLIEEINEDELNQDELIDRIIETGGMLQGAAGFGKSYIVKKVIEKVGADNCVVLGYTNVAANNVGGKTLHNTFKIDIGTGECNFDPVNVFTGKQYVIFEEISQVPTYLYRIIEQAVEMDLKIILVGDFAQILPIDEKENDGTRAVLQTERFLKSICGYKYTMTVYKRGDLELLKTLNSVRDRTYTTGFNTVEVGSLHFCYTKRQRDFINNREMAKITSGYTIMISNSNLPKIYMGMPLRACVTKQDGSYLNNQRWIITTVYYDSVVIRNDDDYLTVAFDTLITDFMPGYAMTIHSSQGLTIKEPYTVWVEWKTAFTVDEKWRMLYTATSRGTTMNQIAVMGL